MSKLWQDILVVGVKIEDDDFYHILQSSFPPSWAPLVTTPISVDDPVALESSLLAPVTLSHSLAFSYVFYIS